MSHSKFSNLSFGSFYVVFLSFFFITKKTNFRESFSLENLSSASDVGISSSAAFCYVIQLSLWEENIVLCQLRNERPCAFQNRKQLTRACKMLEQLQRIIIFVKHLIHCRAAYTCFDDQLTKYTKYKSHTVDEISEGKEAEISFHELSLISKA